MKALGTKFIISFPGTQHFASVVTIHAWRNETCPVITLLGEDPWKLLSGSLQILPHMPFTFNYALHPLMIINHTNDNDYILGSEST